MNRDVVTDESVTSLIHCDVYTQPHQHPGHNTHEFFSVAAGIQATVAILN